MAEIDKRNHAIADLKRTVKLPEQKVEELLLLTRSSSRSRRTSQTTGAEGGGTAAGHSRSRQAHHVLREPPQPALAEPDSQRQKRRKRRQQRRDGAQEGGKPGRKDGHEGSSHARRPSRTTRHSPKRCQKYGSKNMAVSGTYATRQVTDTPKPVRAETVSHIPHNCRCKKVRRHGAGTLP